MCPQTRPLPGWGWRWRGRLAARGLRWGMGVEGTVQSSNSQKLLKEGVEVSSQLFEYHAPLPQEVPLGGNLFSDR